MQRLTTNSHHLLLLGLVLLVGLQGCWTSRSSVTPEKSKLGSHTAVYNELASLPLPKEKVVAAVYSFRDQTGQYKSTEGGGTYSTAVTQGATSMLMQAMEQSRWFIPIEREGLSNLLNERKIIRSSRENYADPQGQPLPPIPPLLYAGVILEGGIISYETNILTGGSGAKYFGIGASDQYRQDRVTIYLRVISTQTGRVLKTVHTTKTILSKMVDIGVYRYVKFKRLLEVETGMSYNEPPQMCVQEAIQKAVLSLIIEGIFEQIWELEDPNDIKSYVIKKYLAEKEETKTYDEYEHAMMMPKLVESFGVSLGGAYYSGDYDNTILKPGGEILVRGRINSLLSMQADLGFSVLSNTDHFKANLNTLGVKSLINFFPNRPNSLYAHIGGSIFTVSSENYSIPLEVSKNWASAISAGGSLEYRLSPLIGLTASLDYYYTLTDYLDGLKHGKINDQFWSGQIGYLFYF